MFCVRPTFAESIAKGDEQIKRETRFPHFVKTVFYPQRSVVWILRIFFAQKMKIDKTERN